VDDAVSVREAEVLALRGELLTHAEIASRPFLSVRAVNDPPDSGERTCRGAHCSGGW
jgi:hypothetical protein